MINKVTAPSHKLGLHVACRPIRAFYISAAFISHHDSFLSAGDLNYTSFLVDQELIAYHYSFVLSLCFFFFFLLKGTTSSKKVQGYVLSNRIGMKFRRIVLEVNTHRLTESEFFIFWRHNFQMAAMTSFNAEKCCHLVIAYAASTRRICSSICHVLIRKTFLLVHSFIHCARKNVTLCFKLPRVCFCQRIGKNWMTSDEVITK